MAPSEKPLNVHETGVDPEEHLDQGNVQNKTLSSSITLKYRNVRTIKVMNKEPGPAHDPVSRSELKAQLEGCSSHGVLVQLC